MAIVTFDTLDYSRTLQKAGIPREQADAFAEAQRKAMSEMIESKDLTTKKDLLDLRQDLIRWGIGSALAQVALTVTLITLLK